MISQDLRKTESISSWRIYADRLTCGFLFLCFVFFFSGRYSLWMHVNYLGRFVPIKYAWRSSKHDWPHDTSGAVSADKEYGVWFRGRVESRKAVECFLIKSSRCLILNTLSLRTFPHFDPLHLSLSIILSTYTSSLPYVGVILSSTCFFLF